VGYVSDENFVALPGVDVELEYDEDTVSVRTTASGAIRADIEPGEYRIVLSKSGYTAKRSEVTVEIGQPIQFRLMSNRMCGLMWPSQVRSGESSEYCVHTTRQFRLELWRYGWDKEFIRSFGWCDEHAPQSMAQILPDGDFTQTGVDWNRTGYAQKYQKHAITAPERSGLYFLHATTLDGEFCAFPWIVSPPTPRAKIAVLASTITWNAYNNFGGRSNYFNQDGLHERPIVNSRQDVKRYTQPDTWPFDETGAPLSFQRPIPESQVPEHDSITDPIAGRVNSAFAPGLWRLLGWLDREEFEYDLYSETELHFDRVPLDDYDVLVLDAHPEYWSKEMYHRVKQWVFERGGKLAYLGGCGLYAEVEFDDEFTMRCRREGEFDLRGESEANLLGVAYTHTGFQTGAPYQVLDDAHWVFAGTHMKNGDLFGLKSLHERCPGGASGHELDKINDQSPADIAHLAKGTNPDGHGADMTLFETPSGGAVFAAGSLCWVMSLPIDEGVSAVTRNVLNQFLGNPPG
jgi:hypothetical protein